jgi:hypothetical protein
VVDGDCDDGVDCTVDACNQGTNECEATPDNDLCTQPPFTYCDPGQGCIEPPPGACCTSDVCAEVLESQCQSNGNYWLGPSVSCQVDTCVACDTGDADYDGDIDFADFAILQSCFEMPYIYPCDCVDIDNDSDVDLDDYALWESLQTGP